MKFICWLLGHDWGIKTTAITFRNGVVSARYDEKTWCKRCNILQSERITNENKPK